MSGTAPRPPAGRPGRWPNLVLVGARASGKSRASRGFAEDTGWTRVSTDERFEEAHGPIPEFVARRGWEAFRGEESRLLAAIAGERLVVDCGGGVVERRENREALRRLGTVYWVRAPLAVLERRLARPKHRRRRPPLLAPGPGGAEADPAEEAARILERRAPLYRSVADRDVWSAAPGAAEEEPSRRLAADALRAAHFGPGIALSVAAGAPERAAAGLLAAWAEAGPDDLLEWRLDALDRPAPEAVRAVLGALPAAALDRLIATARPRGEGGSFRGGEAARIAALVEAARLGAGWLDLEAEADERASPRISEQARRARPEVRLIASRHWFDGAPEAPKTPEAPETLPGRLTAMRPALVKVAVRVRNFAEAAALHRMIRSHAARRRAAPPEDRPPPLLAAAMGEAGEALRVTARAAGAHLSTYAPPAGWPETAPGQSDSDRIRARHRRWGSKLASPAPVHGVAGFPVAQSLSPAMHEAAFRRLGIEAAYLPFEVPPEDLAPFLAAARLAGVAGLNLTVPHKEAAVPLLDGLDEDAARIGAVNTILPTDDGLRGGLLGANTDWIGAVGALEEALGGKTPLAGKRASVIGAGGSARAVLYGLRRSGASATVYARDEARGAACASRFGADYAPLDELRRASANLLVNATPVGMAGGPAEGRSPAPAEAVAAHEAVFDLVFHPRRTPLLELAAAAGRIEVSGLRMLVLQGAAAFTRWTGRPAPLAVMTEAAERADDAR